MPKETRIINLVIADDHTIFREGLRRLLETEPDMRVVGEAADGLEAIQLTKRYAPDVLLLDLAMPRLPGLDTLREISDGKVAVRTILLTAAIEKPQIVQALQLGVRGVVLKESATQLLFESIRAVIAGDYWVGRSRVTDLIQALRDLMRASPDTAKRKTFGLTPRELEIVSAVVTGSTNKDIAQRFSISEQTVKHHLSSIFDKVGVSSRLELALFAINHQLVDQL